MSFTGKGLFRYMNNAKRYTCTQFASRSVGTVPGDPADDDHAPGERRRRSRLGGGPRRGP
jgi:hypothetical protein